MSKISPRFDGETAATPHSLQPEAGLHSDSDSASTARRDGLILLGVLAGVLLWALSFVFFGVPGLYIPAVAAVPVIWLLLLMITRG